MKKKIFRYLNSKSFRQSKTTVNINLNTAKCKIQNSLRIKMSQKPFHLPLTLASISVTAVELANYSIKSRLLSKELLSGKPDRSTIHTILQVCISVANTNRWSS